MSNSGTITAEILLRTESVLLRPNEPFTLTGGKRSPVYVDCRRLIAFPAARKQIIELATAMLDEAVGWDSFDVLAGGETAGIAYAAWLAAATDKPMAYIRKKPKGFGKNARIEGNIHAGQRALLVEDLATDGGSKLSFVDGLRDAGAMCEHCFVVFYYGIFEAAQKALTEAGIALHYLATWRDILEVAEAQNLISPEDLAKVKEFLNAPEEWQEKHAP